MDSMYFPKKKHVFYHDFIDVEENDWIDYEIKTTNSPTGQNDIYSYDYTDRLEVKYIHGGGGGEYEIRLLFSIPNIYLADMTRSFDIGEVEEYDITVLYSEIVDTTLILYNIDISNIEIISTNIYFLDFSTTALFIDGIYYKSDYNKIFITDFVYAEGDNCVVEIISGTDITRVSLPIDEISIPDGTYFVTITTNNDSTLYNTKLGCASEILLSQSDVTRYNHQSELTEFYSPFYEVVNKTYSNSFIIDHTSSLMRDDGLIATFTFGTEESSPFKNKTFKFDCVSNFSTQLYIYDYYNSLIYSNIDSSFVDDVYFTNCFTKTTPALVKIYSSDLIDPPYGDYNIDFDVTIFPCITNRYVSGSINEFLRIIHTGGGDETTIPIEDIEMIFFGGISKNNARNIIFGGLGDDDIEVAMGLGISKEGANNEKFGSIS